MSNSYDAFVKSTLVISAIIGIVFLFLSLQVIRPEIEVMMTGLSGNALDSALVQEPVTIIPSADEDWPADAEYIWRHYNSQGETKFINDRIIEDYRFDEPGTHTLTFLVNDRVWAEKTFNVAEKAGARIVVPRMIVKDETILLEDRTPGSTSRTWRITNPRTGLKPFSDVSREFEFQVLYSGEYEFEAEVVMADGTVDKVREVVVVKRKRETQAPEPIEEEPRSDYVDEVEVSSGIEEQIVETQADPEPTEEIPAEVESERNLVALGPDGFASADWLTETSFKGPLQRVNWIDYSSRDECTQGSAEQTRLTLRDLSHDIHLDNLTFIASKMEKQTRIRVTIVNLDNASTGFGANDITRVIYDPKGQEKKYYFKFAYPVFLKKGESYLVTVDVLSGKLLTLDVENNSCNKARDQAKDFPYGKMTYGRNNLNGIISMEYKVLD